MKKKEMRLYDMKKKSFQIFLIVSAVVAGILYAVCVIWAIYDSVTGGPSRWHDLLVPTMLVPLCAFNFYQYFKDEKSRK